MSENEPPKRRWRGLPNSRRRELSRKTSGTKLWIADRMVVEEIARKEHTTPAEVLRDIVHEWTAKKRLSGLTADTQELAGPVRKMHEQLLAEKLAPVNTALASIIELLKTRSEPAPSSNSDTAVAPSDHPDSALLALLERLADERETAGKHLAELRAFAAAHYMLSGQQFSVAWANLDFILRFTAEPLLRNDPAHTKDSFQASLIHRDDARKEGLQMVEQMSLAFHYPQEYKLVLVNPPDDDV